MRYTVFAILSRVGVFRNLEDGSKDTVALCIQELFDVIPVYRFAPIIPIQTTDRGKPTQISEIDAILCGLQETSRYPVSRQTVRSPCQGGLGGSASTLTQGFEASSPRPTGRLYVVLVLRHMVTITPSAKITK
jgi:hypothetical protein